MKVAYFAESPADQAALTILTEAILEKKTEPVIHAGLRHRGWPAVRTALPAIIRQLHFHTDAEGFVFIVDSNGAPPHLTAHDQANGRDPKCRLCQLHQIVDAVCQQFKPRAHQSPLKTAVGLAVPAIEAWLLCGISSRVSEAAWINGQREGRFPYTKLELKTRLYGTDRPPLDLETEKMKEAASRLAGNLSVLESAFPAGFGALKADLLRW